jgi:hypothetical protein
MPTAELDASRVRSPYAQGVDAARLYAHDASLLALQVCVACTRASMRACLEDMDAWRVRVWRACEDTWTQRDGEHAADAKWLALFDPRERSAYAEYEWPPASDIGRVDEHEHAQEENTEHAGEGAFVRVCMQVEHAVRACREHMDASSQTYYKDVAKTCAERCAHTHRDMRESYASKLESVVREHERCWHKHDAAIKVFEKLTAKAQKSGVVDLRALSVDERKEIDAVATEIESRRASLLKNEELLKTRSREFLAYFNPHVLHLVRQFVTAQCDIFKNASDALVRDVAMYRSIETLKADVNDVALPSRRMLDALPTPRALGSPTMRRVRVREEEALSASSELEEGEIAVDRDEEERDTEHHRRGVIADADVLADVAEAKRQPVEAPVETRGAAA